MSRVFAGDLAQHAGSHVRIAGRLHRRRRLSQITFLVIRDATGLAQVVVTDPEQTQVVAGLSPETVVAVDGTAVASEQAPGGVEIHGPTIELLATPAGAPPFDLHRPRLNVQLPTLLDCAPVALRHPRRRAIFQVTAARRSSYCRTGTGPTTIRPCRSSSRRTDAASRPRRTSVAGATSRWSARSRS